MTERQKILSRCTSAVLFAAAFVFFTFFYRGHLFYNEQYQLFLFSKDYFFELLKLPGGLSAWISRFLIQFFLYPAIGGLVYACAISGVRYLLCRFATEHNFLSDMASLFPALLLWAVLCKENAQINLAVCTLICVGCACVCRHSRYAGVLFLVLTPILYWVCGFASVLFVVSSLSIRKWKISVLSLAITLAIPFAARSFVGLSLTDLYKGYFYWKNPAESFTWPWICFGASAAYAALFSFKLKNSDIAAICTATVSVAAGITAISVLSNFFLEDEMVYSDLTRKEKWNDIIDKANKKAPLNKYSVANLNLALAMKGRLGEDMFKYVQSGPDCLIPEYKLTCTDNLILSDIFYHLSLVSLSQHYIFECKECIKSYEKGSRMYQRLAQTNSVNRHFAVCNKYLDALSKTLFYRKWAADFDHNSQDILDRRALGYQNSDFLFSEDNLLNELGLLYQESPGNDIAFQYAVAYALLKKDLNMFKKISAMKSFVRIPRSYQEAYLIVWTQTHSDLNGLPRFIDSSIARRFVRFAEANQKETSIPKMRKTFGDTYWFYYYYISL